MRIIGLTGGIASGKSTVSAMFHDLGVPIVDADAVYHRLIAPVGSSPSPLARAICDQFPGVLLPDGSLDRPKLGQRVFSDSKALDTLTQLTRPAILKATQEAFRQAEEAGHLWLLYDAPLLYEHGVADDGMDVIVVWVPPEIQEQRLMERSSLSSTEAQRRIAAQLPLGEKRQRATWTIDNSGEKSQTQSQVSTLFKTIEGETGSTG